MEQTVPEHGFLNLIAARPVIPPNDRYTFIRPGEVLYAFRGSALSQGLIDAAWRRQPRLRPDRIYLRTKRGILLTHFRSLQKLMQRLDPKVLTPVHQSILISLNAVAAVDLRARVKTVDIAPGDGSLESLRISRRHLSSLRARLGLPLRSVRSEA